MNSPRARAHLGLNMTKAGRWVTVVATICMIVGLLSIELPVTAQAQNLSVRVSPLNVNGSYPIGTPNNAEPSGQSPPNARALVGYKLSYRNDFTGTKVPPGWNVFTGIPGGDPGGHFGISHVVVANGVLQLNTYRNPSWHNRWVTGGICQCGVARRYGAYFVRSRITGAGPTAVELLWPATNVWPPEIDFNETGGSAVSTTSSVHVGAANSIVRSTVTIDMTLWHTWGVIWTPNYILYTVDGRLWGQFRVPADVLNVPMTLDFEQRQECQQHRQCPIAPESMQIDWVAEYTQS